MSDPGEIIRDLMSQLDLSNQPGRFRVQFCMPTGGSYSAFSGEYTLEPTRDGTGDWIARYEDSGRVWTGRSAWSAGAFLAMIADRSGLVAHIDCKPDPAERVDGG